MLLDGVVEVVSSATGLEVFGEALECVQDVGELSWRFAEIFLLRYRECKSLCMSEKLMRSCGQVCC